ERGFLLLEPPRLPHEVLELGGRRRLSILRDAVQRLPHRPAPPPCNRPERPLRRPETLRKVLDVELAETGRETTEELLAQLVATAAVLDPRPDALVELVPVASHEQRHGRPRRRQKEVSDLSKDSERIQARIAF